MLDEKNFRHTDKTNFRKQSRFQIMDKKCSLQIVIVIKFNHVKITIEHILLNTSKTKVMF